MTIFYWVSPKEGLLVGKLTRLTSPLFTPPLDAQLLWQGFASKFGLGSDEASLEW